MKQIRDDRNYSSGHSMSWVYSFHFEPSRNRLIEPRLRKGRVRTNFPCGEIITVENQQICEMDDVTILCEDFRAEK